MNKKTVHIQSSIRCFTRIYWLLLVAALLSSAPSRAQAPKKTIPDGTDGTMHIVPEIDSTTGKPKDVQPNEVVTPFSTFKLGMGFLPEYAGYVMNDVFKQQMDSAGLEVKSMYETRDFRILASGQFRTKRALSWKFAYMYDGDQKAWWIRESGLTIGVPELAGHFFVGRTKEGYSMVKVMNGYSPWTAERQMALDVIPILADGIKYFGSFEKSRIFWNIGYYNDFVSKGQGFSTYAWQYDMRVGWLPFFDPKTNRVFHIGGNYRYGVPVNGKITLKSRPESNPAPQIINTGSFAADNSTHIGGEAYYSTGRLLLGSEVMVHSFHSNTAANHKFLGGDVVASYLLTNTTRPYNTTSSLFGFVPVRKSVFKGGWGEWEAVLRFSSLDLNDGTIKGGRFWRLTPMVNWYMSKIVRTEFIYGYGQLSRYDLTGALQIYQIRVQIIIL